ncbi:MAG: hypothetical protein RRZ24_11535 [Clostridia bacterium]
MVGNIVGLDLKINENYLEQAVHETVLMGISESLNGKNEVVSQIVKMVLTQKVNNNGTISSYGCENKYTLLEFYVRKLISQVTGEEIQKIVEEHRPKITQSIRTELAKKVNYTKFTDAFISQVSDAVSNTWVPRIEVVFEKRSDE